MQISLLGPRPPAKSESYPICVDGELCTGQKFVQRSGYTKWPYLEGVLRH
jgi:hypothetical protein